MSNSCNPMDCSPPGSSIHGILPGKNTGVGDQSRDQTWVSCTAGRFFTHWSTQLILIYCLLIGFPGNSVGKESTCNAGHPGSIPGLGRSPGEGTGYPLQYSGLEKSMDCDDESSVTLNVPGGGGYGHLFNHYMGLFLSFCAHKCLCFLKNSRWKITWLNEDCLALIYVLSKSLTDFGMKNICSYQTSWVITDYYKLTQQHWGEPWCLWNTLL